MGAGISILTLLLLLAGLSVAVGAREAAAAKGVVDPKCVEFSYFEYTGREQLDRELHQDEFLNPILAGFYPDPSICRVGDDYYLVNSTFAWFPGIPIFHSKDLVNWTQLGHVLSRPSQLNLDGLGVSEGVFAASIEYHD